jgi:NAD(P)-dependent dehydrogenase (short-subunit alcohol dehydrogenase family)
VHEVKPSVVLDNQLLAGKNVLITGAGRNIGRAIALEMAQQGANIFFVELDPARCENLEAELNNFPVKSKGIVADVSKIESLEAVIHSLTQEKIVIDTLVNNVGIQFEAKGLEQFDLEHWHKTYATNIFGPMYLSKLISDLMISHKVSGSIIFMTSIHQAVPVGWPSYSSTKAALEMVIKELALELAKHNIRVNGIAPGYILEDEQGYPLGHRFTPLYQSSINPHYIGRAASYLASNYFSKFTTGTVIKIDAGLSLHSHMSLRQKGFEV